MSGLFATGSFSRMLQWQAWKIIHQAGRPGFHKSMMYS